MARPKRVVIKEYELESAAQAHELLAHELGFADHYGANFDALADCLDEVDKPTRIVLRRDEENPKQWFDMLEQVVREAAQRSCYVGCSIRVG